MPTIRSTGIDYRQSKICLVVEPPVSRLPVLSRGRGFVLALLPMSFAAAQACAQTAQNDPSGSGPILGALQWVQGTLMGNLATTAVVIAVAVVGLMMLTGRIDWRRGVTVVLGAFIVFGAAAIVAGIRSAATGLR
jgi:type IV secretory pathway VirB2 component (pilin)